MPSTYSTDLKLTLMATGEDSGTWGDITNTNLGTLIEQSIVGSATVAMADTDQVLTIPNGATADGRCVYIKCTGALTTFRNLTVPTIHKNYVVWNATTGDHSVVVGTAAGASLFVANGTKRYLYVDGTDVTEALTGFGDVTIQDLSLTTVNRVTITTPNTAATITLADNSTLTTAGSLTTAGAYATTLTMTGATAVTFPTTGTLATTSDISTAVSAALPAGVIVPYGGSTEPSGWIFCYGQSLLRASFAALFTAIGTTYGAADGTHFNVPDLRGRVPGGRDDMGGAAAGRLTATTMTPDGVTLAATGGAQTHTGTVVSVSGTVTVTSGAVNGTIVAASQDVGGSGTNVSRIGDAIQTDPITAAGGNTLTGTVTGNMITVQPTLIVNYLIKST